MNEVCLIGRMTREPEMRRTQAGKAVCNFTVAVDRTTDREKCDFINCIAWGTLAELIQKHCFKGMLCGVSGHLRMDNYEKQGVKVSMICVDCYSVDFLSRKPQENKAPALEDFQEVSGDDAELPF